MPLAMVTLEAAASNIGWREDGSSRVTKDYFGRQSGQHCDPEVFVVEQAQLADLAHSHAVDQFEIVFGANGVYRRDLVVPTCIVRYADAFSANASLSGGIRPWRLFTFRAAASDSMARSRLRRSQHDHSRLRNIVVDVDRLRVMSMYKDGQVRSCHVIIEEPDGLRADRILAEGHSPVVLPSPQGTSGQFVFVRRGSMWFENVEYARDSIGWMSPNDGDHRVVSGDRGVDFLIMRLPYPATHLRRIAS